MLMQLLISNFDKPQEINNVNLETRTAFLQRLGCTVNDNDIVLSTTNSRHALFPSITKNNKKTFSSSTGIYLLYNGEIKTLIIMIISSA